MKNIRKIFDTVFDHILKWKDIPSGKTRLNDQDNNLLNNLTNEVNRIPINFNSLVKGANNQYCKELHIKIDFDHASPFYRGTFSKNKKNETEMEEELATLIRAYIEYKYDEWRDSP